MLVKHFKADNFKVMLWDVPTGQDFQFAEGNQYILPFVIFEISKYSMESLNL